MAGFQEMLEMRMEESYPWRSHLMNKGYKFDSYSALFKPVATGEGSPKINDPAPYSKEDSETAFLTDKFLELMPAYAERNQGWF